MMFDSCGTHHETTMSDHFRAYESSLQPPSTLGTRTDNKLDLEFLQRNEARKALLLEKYRKELSASMPIRRFSEPDQTETELEAFRWNEKYTIKSGGGTTVQLRNGNLLKVLRIIRAKDSSILLRGWYFRPWSALTGPTERNYEEDVSWYIRIDQDDPRPAHIQSQVQESAVDIIRVVKLIMTNFDSHSLQLPEDVFVCRYKAIEIASSGTKRMKGEYSEKVFQLLEKQECDNGYGMTGKKLRDSRGTQSFGLGYGRCDELGSPSCESYSERPAQENLGTSGLRDYTFGDVFCGAGGISTGAREAGFEVKWAFDSDEAIKEIYKANFPSTKVIVTDTRYQPDAVDVLHFSPPCKPWCVTHTTTEKKEEINESALSVIASVLRTIQPRICTFANSMEPEEGSLDACDNIITEFVHIGWSVRCKRQSMESFGCPKMAYVLVMIASAPGEALPEFPRETHSECGIGGLKPWSCIRDWLADLDTNDPYHDLDDALLEPSLRLSPYSSMDLAETIFCEGVVDMYHPSGVRVFTMRELARLQTVPKDFQLVGNMEVVKQAISNMVPPVYSEQLFRGIMRHLREVDRQGNFREDGTAESQIINSSHDSIARIESLLCHSCCEVLKDKGIDLNTHKADLSIDLKDNDSHLEEIDSEHNYQDDRSDKLQENVSRNASISDPGENLQQSSINGDRDIIASKNDNERQDSLEITQSSLSSLSSLSRGSKDGSGSPRQDLAEGAQPLSPLSKTEKLLLLDPRGLANPLLQILEEHEKTRLAKFHTRDHHTIDLWYMFDDTPMGGTDDVNNHQDNNQDIDMEYDGDSSSDISIMDSPKMKEILKRSAIDRLKSLLYNVEAIPVDIYDNAEAKELLKKMAIERIKSLQPLPAGHQERISKPEQKPRTKSNEPKPRAQTAPKAQSLITRRAARDGPLKRLASELQVNMVDDPNDPLTTILRGGRRRRPNQFKGGFNKKY